MADVDGGFSEQEDYVSSMLAALGGSDQRGLMASHLPR